ncbi:hypothetical protein KL920_003102 [Ogataea angusta]|nr:hypothetical protein KL920_003102 [Ogataea angusta]
MTNITPRAPQPPQPGVYTPVPTFFKKDLVTIDFETQIAHAKYLRDNGIKGLVLMGSTGEAAHLTRTERVSIIEAIHKNLPGFPILAGVAQNCLEEVLHEIDAVKEAGASYALVLSSSYYGPGIKQAAIEEFYTEVANQSSLPIMVYVYPGVTNNIVVEPETIVKLSRHPNIVGTKISHGDVAHHTMIAMSPVTKENNFYTFTGLGQILLPVLMVGGMGTVDALSGAFPKLYVKIFELFQAKQYEEAAKLQFIATRAEELVVRFGVVGIKKMISIKGFGETYLGRMPLNQDVDHSYWAHFKQNISEIVEAESVL